jgi:hypothetical protein
MRGYPSINCPSFAYLFYRLTGLVAKLVRLLLDLKGWAYWQRPGNNDSADDMKNVDLTRIHYLSGPFEVETAEPGDVLLVEIMDVQPHQKHPWGL